MTKKAQKDRDEAIATLREWIKPGDTVYTILDSVSKSGMSRQIRVLVPYITDQGKVDFVHPNYATATLIGARQNTQTGAIKVSGCGMDMGWHLVNSLSMALYPEYACPGKGCPSNQHRNSGPDRDNYGSDVLHKDGYALQQRWL